VYIKISPLTPTSPLPIAIGTSPKGEGGRGGIEKG